MITLMEAGFKKILLNLIQPSTRGLLQFVKIFLQTTNHGGRTSVAKVEGVYKQFHEDPHVERHFLHPSLPKWPISYNRSTKQS